MRRIQRTPAVSSLLVALYLWFIYADNCALYIDGIITFLRYNGTGAPPADTSFVVPQEKVLVNLTGSQWEPITGVKLTNIKYTAAAPTYMERHGVPSAGDWALDRFAAIFLQGTEGVTINNCTFERTHAPCYNTYRNSA